MKHEMQIVLWIGCIAAFSVGLATTGCAGGGNDGPNAIKPYYYQPPGGPLNSVEQQQLMTYRDQLQQQQQSLQLKQDRGTSGPMIPAVPFQAPVNPATTNSQLFQTQNELDRVNGLLNPVPGAGPVAPAPVTSSPPLPIMPSGMGTQFVITTH
jgi:hypothetical protein